jgi:hypothetical protein
MTAFSVPLSHSFFHWHHEVLSTLVAVLEVDIFHDSSAAAIDLFGGKERAVPLWLSGKIFLILGKSF